MRLRIISKHNYPELKRLRDNFKISEKKYDLCIAIGGDATFMKAAQEFDGPILPIRSNERGSIGYYSDIGLEDIDYIIDKLKRDEYLVKSIGKKIEITYKGRKYYAVNEARLNNFIENVSFKIYELNDTKKRLLPYIMSGDGVLVTSSVGSTAYNRSAGGPIILSREVICITFINPDGPYRSPIIIDGSKRLVIEVVKYSGALRYDNVEIGRLNKKDAFSVQLSNKSIKIVRFKDKEEKFADKLRRIIDSRLLDGIEY